MKSVSPRIDSLREMLGLEEKRATLQSQLDTIEERMKRLQGSLFSPNTVTSTPSKSNDAPKSKAPKAAPASRRKSSPRGALKEKIMSALESAGDAGIRVKDLAASLGTKAVNVHSWFHSNVKRNPAIHKVSGGHYRFKGEASGEAASAPAAAEAKPSPSTSGRKKSRGKGSKRGELSSQILKGLESAGPEGIAVRQLADNLNAKYKNIYIWFATTGKKNPAIEKVGPATYKLNA